MAPPIFPGLYLHVPFCARKCSYCDFYSVTSRSLRGAWLAAVRQEMRLYEGKFSCFDTLYLGGGTPSLLSARELTTLLADLRRHFAFAADTEVTLEANPDDLSPEKLALYRDLGINRLSLGVQSFDEEELIFLGRRHTARQTLQVIEWIRAAGFTNLGLDLMYGLPGRTEEAWLRTLNRALSFQPEHLSCYQLTLEPGTPLGRRLAAGEFPPVGEEESRGLFLLTSRFLEEHGYQHYEVSNFALKRPGAGACYSRHNGKYWRHVPYLGLGPGAHSFQIGHSWASGPPENHEKTGGTGFQPVRLHRQDAGATRNFSVENGAHCAPYILETENWELGTFQSRVRWWNHRSLARYCRDLEQGRAPVEGREILTPEQLRLETLYLGFRTRQGVSLDVIRQHPGGERVLAQLQTQGLVRLHHGRVTPTREGLVVADRLPLLFE